MPNYTSPMAERVFIQAQPSLTTMLNTSGTWSSAGAQYVAIEENAVTLSPNEPKIPLNFKHGSPSPLGSIQGRKSGSWGLTAPIFPNGTQAVAPDVDLLLQGVFGAPGGVVTGTAFGNAWQYGFTNFAAVPLSVIGWNHGQTSIASRYGLGCIVERCTITYNGNILSLAVNGSCVAVGTVESFPVLDPDAQGGLTAFPTEPGSFSSNGHAIHGYGGGLAATIGSTTYPLAKVCNNLTLDITTGLQLYDEFVDTLYPGAVLFGRRAVTLSVGFVNSNDNATTQLKAAARTNTPVTIGYQLGTVPGQRMYITVNRLQLVPETMRDNGSYVQLDFGAALASVLPGGSDDALLGFA